MPGADAFPPISVVVCTRDRPDSIGRTLDSIAKQRYPRFEVLIIDQSRGEHTRRLVDEFRPRIAELRYMHLERPGLSHAYNTAIRASNARMLAFTDDDAVAPPDWLKSIAAAFANHPGVALLYGQVLIPEELAGRENQDGVTPGLPIPRRRLLDRRHGFQVFGMGANFAARRDLFDRVGGFDEVLGGGAPLQSSQDFDFGYRVFKSGDSTLLEPDVVVYHYGFRSNEEWPATVRSYGVGVGGFYFKHVRMGDAYAARLLLSTLLSSIARCAKRLLQRQPAATQWAYARNILAGIFTSMRFPVDRRLRIYRSPA
jgi:GT2 family glycosyltransferase